MLKAKESSSDLDWGQAMANGADLEWMGRQDVAPQVMLTSYLSVISPKKKDTSGDSINETTLK